MLVEKSALIFAGFTNRGELLYLLHVYIIISIDYVIIDAIPLLMMVTGELGESKTCQCFHGKVAVTL